jgi:hypothetical protein
MLIIVMALLAAPPGCAGHELTNQHQDVASVRRVDSAWSAAYIRGDTAFFRCLLTPDYKGYNVAAVESGRDDEVGKAARYGRPDRPLVPYPNPSIEMHGSSAIVNGVTNTKRWIDVYRFEDGGWHAFFSVDLKIPEASPAS